MKLKLKNIIQQIQVKYSVYNFYFMYLPNLNQIEFQVIATQKMDNVGQMKNWM